MSQQTDPLMSPDAAKPWQVSTIRSAKGKTLPEKWELLELNCLEPKWQRK